MQVYLNGRYTNQDEALISPSDRGFLFADGVYEVIKFYNGKPFRWDDHMNRLRNSLKSIHMDDDVADDMPAIADRLIEINGQKTIHAGVYIQVTRGIAPRMHRFPDGPINPTVYANSFAMPPYLNELTRGIKLIAREDIRWLRCDIKSVGLLANTLLFQEAFEAGAGECLLIRNGLITEASHSSFFAAMDGCLYTHPDSNLILASITKMAVRDICTRENIPLIELPVPASSVPRFGECFIAGTGSEIMPVIQIDDTSIGAGTPGPLTRRVQNSFFEMTHGQTAGKSFSL